MWVQQKDILGDGDDLLGIAKYLLLFLLHMRAL